MMFIPIKLKLRVTMQLQLYGVMVTNLQYTHMIDYIVLKYQKNEKFHYNNLYFYFMLNLK